ncbi:phosphoenolpyruvate synthase [Paraflavitalea soli]|uniref:Phosphoenolpyruvate synthase n=1 Tax=Paraflavitalea soli TaxID=2315862 RepID=A0A3B7MK75_9BACT|nr:phosphoenolpyruvate synthase [Paraflavitalea soli]AXY74047.1 phosphoenolpyruvate synthase [Paraflavitalea soli]
MSTYIKQLKEVSMQDVAVVGGKNASLGEMLSQLARKGINVPDGFATTAIAFRLFLQHNNLDQPLDALMRQLDRQQFTNLKETGAKARALLQQAELQPDLREEIIRTYHAFSGSKDLTVAVRSSATAEDLPEASFAGQHESFLNVTGEKALLEAVHQCFVSLYTDRAIKYREDNGFRHNEVALSAGIQRMVRADLGCAGVAFTVEPESGFKGVVHLSGAWGLGENVVQGTVTPDEFIIFKETLRKGKKAIIQKTLGEKARTMVYGETGTVNVDTPLDKRNQYVLSDAEITTLANWALLIEDHYGKPMDIEWAKDGHTGGLFIVQARPETVHSSKNAYQVTEYKLLETGERLTTGEAIGSKIATGIARILHSPKDADRLKPGEIVVTEITSPDWDPVLKNAGGIITDKGGRTSHASIVARELGVPAIVGCSDATQKIQDGDLVTVSCAEGKTGFVYKGMLKYEENALDFSRIEMPVFIDVMMILGDPEKAFQLSFYPSKGVGLMRMEFIITHAIKVHPMALVKFNTLKDGAVKQAIEALTFQYADKRDYFTDKLSQGIATIAAAFYPREVIVRMSDFKTNEYANLLGGKEFEPEEENPMLGFRGASRYYNERYREGFELECKAIRIVREEMGLTNVNVMIPFCRTVAEGEKVLQVMDECGLARGRQGLKVLVMAEIPSNVLLASEFARIFDGFSIGSNDLTQLTLGVDRDSAIVSDLFDEQDKAAKKMFSMVIREAKKSGVHVGLCGQAPSDFPAFTQFLAEQSIDSISFNPDALLKGIENINQAEKIISESY